MSCAWQFSRTFEGLQKGSLIRFDYTLEARILLVFQYMQKAMTPPKVGDSVDFTFLSGFMNTQHLNHCLGIFQPLSLFSQVCQRGSGCSIERIQTAFATVALHSIGFPPSLKFIMFTMRAEPVRADSFLKCCGDHSSIIFNSQDIKQFSLLSGIQLTYTGKIFFKFILIHLMLLKSLAVDSRKTFVEINMNI